MPATSVVASSSAPQRSRGWRDRANTRFGNELKRKELSKDLIRRFPECCGNGRYGDAAGPARASARGQ
ncbi:hypothetical protein [Bradyrhizobium sp. WD16]|uniref:hypothetical protein n=1 Tax=Bradyrhizobium sp. WD16 TaxID=1521768 RepID=UPI0020A4A837|nr:hypothetical protein [Bradyrhizobium sp. WD16]UTD27039.1 hypothetical protein DB459_08990 [Bradyrhizobium sp. WD16]